MEQKRPSITARHRRFTRGSPGAVVAWGFAAALVTLGPAVAAGEQAAPAWPQALHARLLEADAAYAGELGVYVKDLGSGLELSLRADEHWYLASGIKVPVAIEVLRAVDRGELGLDTPVRLEPGDYVDGAGRTWRATPGSRVSVRDLLERMLIESDNTASDALIRTVGIEQVNALAAELAPDGFGRITTLADVRRHAYSAFHADAFRLTGAQLLTLRAQREEQAQIATLAKLLHVSRTDFAVGDLDSAFDRYYATGLNGARLSAYGRLLEALVGGAALSPSSTAYLLGVLRRTATGEHRIKAGLPSSALFAHKTGTQRARACDLGVVSVDVPDEKQVIIAACARGDRSMAAAERALRSVGEAILASGVLD